MKDPFEEPNERCAEIVRQATELVRVDDDDKQLKKIETRVLSKSMDIVADALHFGDIPMGGDRPVDADGKLGEAVVPPEWIDEVGPERAEKRLRLALMAQMNAKEAPVGLRLAKEVMVGVIKARATEKGDAPKLNLNVTKIDFQLPDFPRLLVEK